MAETFAEADKLMQAGIAQRFFPGAVLLVSAEGRVLFEAAYGWADLFNRQPMTCDAIFDLASLTKPLATTLAVMDLVQQGRLELDRPCFNQWPFLKGSDKADITVRHLLSHCSGLPAWKPYYLRLQRVPADERVGMLRQWLFDEPLEARPGKRAEYSDLGFLMLQHWVEEVAGQPLDRYVADAIYGPLDMGLFFIGPSQTRSQNSFAATELCMWRNRLLKGEVHDDNANVIGGVGGHAGLFGSASAVAEMLLKLLASDQGQSQSCFDQTIVQTFFKRQGHGDWALGFDTRAEQNSSAGSHFSADSVGHLGYTGTSFWMDRSRALMVVLLTNRVHPTRYNEGIKAFRPKLHDAVMACLIHQ